ncbi:MAG: hypothetical protein ACETWG_09020 [Candidatus Neomarinimicrobiota bacterium]
MNSRSLILLIALSLLLSSCGKNPAEPPDENGGDDGNGATPGLPSPAIDSYPSWSPDGQTIAFYHHGVVYDPVSDLGESTDPDSEGIWFIAPDGSDKRMFLKGARLPAWGPPGEWLAFVAGTQIFKIKVNGDSLTQLTFEGRNFFPTWSPDGKWITYDSNTDSPNGMYFIWKMMMDGSGKRCIAFDPEKGEIRQPHWSLEDGEIVHIRYGYAASGEPEIFTMDTAGASILQCTHLNAWSISPKFSYDGAKIAFASSSGIWIMDRTGENKIQLTSNGGIEPFWSPDGKHIVYVGPEQTLWIMDADGGNKRQLTFRPKPV